MYVLSNPNRLAIVMSDIAPTAIASQQRKALPIRSYRLKLFRTVLPLCMRAKYGIIVITEIAAQCVYTIF